MTIGGRHRGVAREPSNSREAFSRPDVVVVWGRSYKGNARARCRRLLASVGPEEKHGIASERVRTEIGRFRLWRGRRARGARRVQREKLGAELRPIGVARGRERLRVAAEI